ncbi:MAG: hypothetical protein LBT32_06950 [Peptococcaceae bacterium]|nr:hypothetical protein [Peptococcaceae bacterium]
MLDGRVTVYVGRGAEKALMEANWADDDRVSEIIRTLNFGKYAEGKKEEEHNAKQHY